MFRKPKVVRKIDEKALLLVVGAAALVGVATLSFTSVGLASERDPAKVLTVDNPNVSCQSPVTGPKVEGDLGRTIVVSAEDPIDLVTVKSGRGAVVVSAEFDTHQGQITLSKDVSSYVVWTCPPTTTTPPPTATTPPTITTPPTTTPTSTTQAATSTVS
jgi:hypothetical protein